MTSKSRTLAAQFMCTFEVLKWSRGLCSTPLLSPKGFERDLPSARWETCLHVQAFSKYFPSIFQAFQSSWCVSLMNSDPASKAVPIVACRNGDGLLTAAELKAGQLKTVAPSIKMETTWPKLEKTALWNTLNFSTRITYCIPVMHFFRSREGWPQRQHPWWPAGHVDSCSHAGQF